MTSTPPPPTEAPAPDVPAAARELSPADCAAQLKQRFPALFSGTPKPLKLRIQADIQERAPGVFSKQALSAFLRRHTGSTAYLIALSKNTQRFDLDGAPAGELSAEHRQLAAEELTRRRAVHESRRELEEQQRRNRAGLLRDFQTTTLTPANFCALKGVAVEELDGLLAIARAEAEEWARQAPPQRRDAREHQDRRSPGGQRPDRPRPPRERR
ncbi:ProQ/FINO family protein [Rivibacter subsaxonicus]|uniref:ProQ/FINO family protein n=1 Tax=Rivibacter subsaxonicus TaxID=457575 RepID=A0A4Q7VX87_9BURK|nr:ProQ/FinO family protein [Rivibacter subsaxonicus]RZU01118.1 ProQ/FINO family protein [Rivibacter subsaxonicus]